MRNAPRISRPESNTRLTSSVAAVLFVLLAVEGLTIVKIHPLLNWHIFFGMLLVPPVLLKIGSTGYRFAKYYLRDPEFRKKGPPVWLLRMLGPFEVVLTIVVFGSGIALLYTPDSYHSNLLFVHKASFVLWFGATTIHVLGHLRETYEFAPLDWLPRGRSGPREQGSPSARATGAAPSNHRPSAYLEMASGRRVILLASLGLGVILGLIGMGRTTSFFTSNLFHFH